MSSSGVPAIEIRPFQKPEDAIAFRVLNEEWIEAYFTMEAKDREVLEDPETAILLKGGHIYMVEADGRTVGCVGLIPMGDGVYELAKMAVSPQLRGKGLGRKLLQHVIEEARAIGAKGLFLGSSTKLKNAVGLYESVGFRHVPAERLPHVEYARADVFMEMGL